MSRTRYGIFPWNDCGCYRPAEAMKVYKLRHAADREANRLTEAGYKADFYSRGFVVRQFIVNDQEQPSGVVLLAY